MMIKELVILAVCLVYGVNSANILGITTLMSHSHHLWNEILAMGLVERGHNVTLLSHDKPKRQHANYTVMVLEGGYELLEELSLEQFLGDEHDMSAQEFWDFMQIACALDVKTNTLRALLNYPKDYKFDLVLWDMNAGECLFPLVKRFGDPPVVGLSAFGVQPYISQIMGNHIFNYIPSFVSLPTDHVNFWERVQNSYSIFQLLYSRKYDYMPKIREHAEVAFGKDVAAAIDEVERKISVALVNTDANFDFPQPLPPNIIPVGGLQATEPKPLPKNLQQILDGATSGAIYFSMGSNLRSERMSDNFFDSFTKCFAKLPYTVLWKIQIEGRQLPKNVIAQNWMPQSDILAHPNVKLFITHGGALSTQESMMRGVPVVGVPVYLDQINNIDKIVTRGLGKKITLKELSEANVCEAIKEVIGKKTYKEKMMLVSERVRDQESTPLNRAIFWVEYVLRHKTGEHLSAATRDMSFIENYNLDIIFLIFLTSSLPFVLIMLCCCCFCRSSTAKVKTN